MTHELPQWPVSAHPRIKDKPAVFLAEFADGWQQRNLTLHELEQLILAGSAFVPAAMSSSRRASSAFAGSALVVVDIDSGLDIDAFVAHAVTSQCAFAYTTPSHVNLSGQHRLRAVFALEEEITDPELYSALVTELISAYGGDTSCKDCCRLFYGNSNGWIITRNHDARLDGDWLSRGRAGLAAKPVPRGQDLDERSIETARFVLSEVLPPIQEGERQLFERITAAVASAADELLGDWQDWVSRGSRAGNRRESSERFLRGFKGTSLATLFYLADQAEPGWRDRLPAALRATSDPAAINMAAGTTAVGYTLADFMDDDEDIAARNSQRAKTQDIFTALMTMDPPGVQTPPPGPEATSQPAAAGSSSAAPSPKRSNRLLTPTGSGSDLDTVLQWIDVLYPGARLNLLTLQIEYVDGKHYTKIDDPSLAYIELSRASGKVLGKNLCFDTLTAVARSRACNPATEYLDHCLAHATPIDYFDRLASTLLGLGEASRDSRLSNGRLVADEILRRALIGAVARAYQPGCAHTWMPILVGPQNCGKTNFWRLLTPVPAGQAGTHPLHATIQQGMSYIKDRPHVLHAGWIVVLDETNRYFNRRYVEEFKNIVSVNIDLSARKYENERVFPRSFILAGATNSGDLLLDPTGNRRFMPIHVQGIVPSGPGSDALIIDLDRLKVDRDRIWAAAAAAYKANPAAPGNEFTSKELLEMRWYLQGYHRDSALTEQVAQALSRNSSGIIDGQNYVLLADLMRWLQVPIDRQPGIQQAVIDELKTAGYVNKRSRVAGRIMRYWVQSEH